MSINKWLQAATIVIPAWCGLMPSEMRAADTNQPSAQILQQVLERLEKDEAEIKALKAELAARAPAAAQPTNAATPAPDSRLQQQVEKDEAALKDLQSQINGEATAALKPKYPNIQFHGFGDFDYAADSRRSSATPTPTGVTYLGGKNTFFEGELDLFTTSQL